MIRSGLKFTTAGRILSRHARRHSVGWAPGPLMPISIRRGPLSGGSSAVVGGNSWSGSSSTCKSPSSKGKLQCAFSFGESCLLRLHAPSTQHYKGTGQTSGCVCPKIEACRPGYRDALHCTKALHYCSARKRCNPATPLPGGCCLQHPALPLRPQPQGRSSQWLLVLQQAGLRPGLLLQHGPLLAPVAVLPLPVVP